MTDQTAEEYAAEDLAYELFAATLKELDRSTRADVTALLSYGEPGTAIDALLYAIEHDAIVVDAGLLARARAFIE
jgi:hypothetical protein